MKKSTEEKKWLVSNFKLYSIPNREEVYCYLPNNSAKIKHDGMRLFLVALKNKEGSVIDDEMLEKILNQFNLDPKDALEYLVNDLGVLSLARTAYFDSIDILTDNDNVYQRIKTHFKGMNVRCYDESATGPKSLVLIFKMEHNKDDYMIPQNPSMHSNYFLTSYLYHHYLIIDNPYIRDKGIPCHFCRLSHEQMILPSSDILAKDSWYSFYQDYLENIPGGVPSTSLSPAQEYLLSFHLIDAIEGLINPRKSKLLFEDSFQTSQINLINGEHKKQVARHWIHCECTLE